MTRAEVAERRARALQMRVAGVPYQAIADQLGHKTAGAAAQDVTRALEARRDDMNGPADEFTALELERLEAMERAAWTALRRRHVLVSHGRVMRGEDGQPMPDDDAALRAIDRLLRIGESRRALLAARETPREVSGIDELRARRAARAAG